MKLLHALLIGVLAIGALLIVGKLSLRSTWEAKDSLYVRAQEHLGIGDAGWIRDCMNKHQTDPAYISDLRSVPEFAAREDDVLRITCALHLEDVNTGIRPSPTIPFQRELEKRLRRYAEQHSLDWRRAWK